MTSRRHPARASVSLRCAHSTIERLHKVYNPYMPNEDVGANFEDGPDIPSELSGTDALFYALSDALKSKASKEAVASLIASAADVVKKYADGAPDRLEAQKRAVLQGTLLSAFMFVVIALLGWLRVITSESTATLIAALLGYLFFQRKGSQ
jgi:hypothetical protein